MRRNHGLPEFVLISTARQCRKPVGILSACLIVATAGCGEVIPRQPESSPSPAQTEPAPEPALVAPPSNDNGHSPEPEQTPLYVSSKWGVPAEFEEISALYLGCTELLKFHSQALVDIVAALDGTVPVIGIVSFHHQEEEVLKLLQDAGVSAHNLAVTTAPSMGMWIRDYGPTFVRHEDGHLVALDAQYDRKGYEDSDRIPLYVAGYLKLPVISIPIRMEGGNVLSNGEGIVLTTEVAVTENRVRGYDETRVGRILRLDYGADEWIILPSLIGDTTRHIDMFMTMVGPDRAVLARADSTEDPMNARQLDRAAESLARVQTEFGPMKVVRVPIRPNPDGFWRPYTNVVFANGTLLVPIYPDTSPDLDDGVLAIYAELLPGWRIVPVDASSLARRGGSLRCVTLTVPAR
jgi:agmatine deiminase